MIKEKVYAYYVEFEDLGNTGWTIFPEEGDKIISKKLLTKKLWNEIKNGTNPEQIGYLNAEFRKWRRATGR